MEKRNPTHQQKNQPSQGTPNKEPAKAEAPVTHKSTKLSPQQAQGADDTPKPSPDKKSC